MDHDRDDILGATDPWQLFGVEPGDDRGARRAYARLAKAWRDDAEVAEHLRTLLDQARRGDPVPEAETPGEEVRSPVEHMVHALQARDLARVVAATEAHGAALRAEAPGVLSQALLFQVVGWGPDLTLAQRDVVRVLIDDPTWEPPPETVRAVLRGLDALQELDAARNDPALPGPLVAGIAEVWGWDIVAATRVWADTAAALEGVDLAPVFARLESCHPVLFGRIRRMELQMLIIVENDPVGRSAADLQEDFAPLHLLRPIAQRAVDRTLRTPRWVTAFAAALVLVPGCTYLLLLAYVERFDGGSPAAFLVPLLLVVPFAGWIWRATRTSAELQRRRSFVLEDPAALEILRARARKEAWWPRELAASVATDVPLGRRSYREPHALWRFDSEAHGLLTVLTPAHADRMARITEESDDG